MNRLLSAAVALLCALGFAVPAYTQTTTITASSLKMAGTTIASGQALFTAVDSVTGAPIGFSDGSGTFNAPGAFSCTITAGALSGCTIPDSALTTPQNIVYQGQLINTTTSKSYTYPKPIAGITGTTWALDHYGPPANTTAIQTISSQTQTIAPPSGSGVCVNGSFYVYSGPNGLYNCIAGAWVVVSGGPASPATASTFGLVKLATGQTSTTLAKVATTGAASDLTGTLPAAQLPALTGDATCTTGTCTVVGIQGKSVSTTAPTDGQGLIWSASLNKYVPQIAAAPVTYGTTSGTAAQGNDARILASMKYQSAYSSGTTYAANDVVLSGGIYYLSLSGGNSGHPPSTSTSYWSALSTAYHPFNLRGAWAASTAYAQFDSVTYSGASYVATTAFTSGSSFDATNFMLLAAQGATGAPGGGASVDLSAGGTISPTAGNVSVKFTTANVSQLGTATPVDGQTLAITTFTSGTTVFTNQGASFTIAGASSYNLQPKTFYFWAYSATRTNWDLLYSYAASSFAAYPLASKVTGGNFISATAGLQYLGLYGGGFAADTGTGTGTAEPIGGQVLVLANIDGSSNVSFQRYGNSHTINGVSADYAIVGKGRIVTFVYEAADTNWRIVSIYDPATPLPPVTYVGAANLDIPRTVANFVAIITPTSGQILGAVGDGSGLLPVDGQELTLTIVGLPVNFTNQGQAFTIAGQSSMNLLPGFTYVFRFFVGSANFQLVQTVNPLLQSDTAGNFWALAWSSGEIETISASADPTNVGHVFGGFKAPKSARTYHAKGDSITAGTGSSSPAATSYPAVVNANLGYASFRNDGVPSDESVDMVYRLFQVENPCRASAIDYSVAIGTNNIAFQGSGSGLGTGNAAKTLFQSDHMAAITWLATNCEDKIQGGAMTMGTGFTADTGSFAAVTAANSTTPGSTLTASSFVTYGGPIYIYSKLLANGTGSFTYAIDGGSAATVSLVPPASIITPNGNSTDVLFKRVPVAAGTHSVVFTNTSSTTSAADAVEIVAIGTPGPQMYYLNKVVSGGVPPQGLNINAASNAIYTSWTIQDVKESQMDGLDVTYWDNRTPLNNGEVDLYADAVTHPNDTGYALEAASLIQVLQMPPGPWVKRGTPASASSPCTPGETWAATGYVYGCAGYGSIQRAAIAGW